MHIIQYIEALSVACRNVNTLLHTQLCKKCWQFVAYQPTPFDGMKSEHYMGFWGHNYTRIMLFCMAGECTRIQRGARLFVQLDSGDMGAPHFRHLSN